MHGQGHLHNTASVGWSWHWLIFVKCLVRILTGTLIIIITGFRGFSQFVHTYAETIPLIRPWPLLITAFRIHYLLSCSQDTLYSLKLPITPLNKPQIIEEYAGFGSVIAVLMKIQVVKPWTGHTLKMESESSYETMYIPTRCHIPDRLNLQVENK
jgi:hypothetical protein